MHKFVLLYVLMLFMRQSKFETISLMDRYYDTFSLASLKMVSKKCPIIAQQVVIIFPTEKVTIATLEPLKIPLILV